MTPRDLWSEWAEPFDLFVSYARADNATGTVTALVEAVEAEFAAVAPGEPLRVFFDKDAIRDMQDWQERLRQGLRQSKVMLAILSPAYFASEWCRREWEEYVLVEAARTYPGEALAPIFAVAPGDLAPTLPPAAREWWDHVTGRNAVVEIHPFWSGGPAALRDEAVRRRLGRLVGNLRDRVEHGRVLARVPRNIRGRNASFVGREKELTALRTTLSRFEMAGVCAVNGVGGVGKSSLAREYAHRYRREYLGGQFEIDLSTTDSVRGVQSQLVGLARDYLGADIPPPLPEDEQARRAKAAFEALPPGRTALLILDNLNEDALALVGRANRDAYPSLEKVHLLVTTRAEPRSLGGVATVSLDVLTPAEALDLLGRHRPFDHDPADPDYLRARDGTFPATELTDGPPVGWKTALAIAERLGRHTLAVTLVAAYLGSYPDLAYDRFAADLDEHGLGLALDAAGSDERVRNLVQHPETLIGPLFERSVARLSPLALRVLEYAAFLPPDLVPLAWLKRLAEQDADLADALMRKPFQPPPWEETLRTLDGLRHLQDEPFARMHRVVQEVIRRRITEADRAARAARVMTFVEDRVRCNADDAMRFDDVRAIAAAEEWAWGNANQDHPLVGNTALCLVNHLMELGRLRAALRMVRLAERIVTQVARTDPASAEKRRNLAIVFDRLGDVSRATGDLAAARDYFDQGHAIVRDLAAADPDSAGKRYDLSFSFERLGEVSVTAGNLAAARKYFKQMLALRRELAAADPASEELQRSLSFSLHHLGRVSVMAGNLAAARKCFEEGLAIARDLAAADPASAMKQRDLALSLLRLGDVSVEARNLAAARKCFEEGHAIARSLAAADPASAMKQRDLTVSLERLGDVSRAEGNLAAARTHFEEGLAIARDLAAADPASAQNRGDLALSLLRLGDVSRAEENLEAAREYFEEGLAIARDLAAADPASAQKRRDLALLLLRLGDVSRAERNLRAAREYLEDNLVIAQDLADADPASAEKRRDLAIAFNMLGNVSAEAGDLEAAKGHFALGFIIAQGLAAADPASAQKRRDLGVSHDHLARLEERLGNRAAAREHLARLVAIWGRLHEEGRLPHPDDQRLLATHRQWLAEWDAG